MKLSGCPTSTHVIALSERGQCYAWGNGKDGRLGHGDLTSLKLPKQIALLSGVKVKQISSGIAFSLALTER